MIAPSFLLHPSAFGAHATAYRDWPWALALVLLAGLSQTVGQSIILFVNRVSPLRFFFSLLVGALLYAVGFLFLVAGTWITTIEPGQPHVDFLQLALVMAFAYVPLLPAFLAAMPYFGSPVLALLRVWHLAALALGFASLAHTSLLDGLWHVSLGWLLLQVVERTVGQPVANLGRRVADAVAGVTLADENTAVLKRAWVALKQRKAPGTRAPRDVAAKAKTRRRWTSLALGLAALAAFTYGLGWLLSPVHATLFGWSVDLPLYLRPVAALLWIAVVGIVAAALLAPLETLGWWAGWFGEPLDGALPGDPADGRCGTLERRADATGPIERWGIYLDGISQSSSRYTADVETFLDALVPALPRGAALIRGLMAYSVLNRPLDASRGLGMLWDFLDRVRFKNPQSIAGMIVNLRNVFVVGVSADARYGPLYNRGIAQIAFDALREHGYAAGSGTPLVLIGYSGGGQISAAIAPMLASALGAPVSIVSLGGVMTGDCDFLAIEHLYHFVGRRDGVEPVGVVMFWSRWKIAVLSNWNRALRLGKISLLDAGPVGHQVPGGYMDPDARMPDGRTNLTETVANVAHVLRGQTAYLAPKIERIVAPYLRRRESPFACEERYPLGAAYDERFRPVAPWTGRLILPDPAERERGVLFEVRTAPPEHAALEGRTIPLRRASDDAPARDVTFSARAAYAARYGGIILPERLNHSKNVTPLESLAGAHPFDDVAVSLDEDAVLTGGDAPVLQTLREPMQIRGSRYAALRFVGPLGKGDRYRVRYHDGSEGDVHLPGRRDGIEHAPENDDGWYAYGDDAADGLFVVRALAPRAAMRAGAGWNEGDTALAVYAAEGPHRYGRFSYGRARVVRDPLTGELRFEIRYGRIAEQDGDGTIAGATQHLGTPGRDTVLLRGFETVLPALMHELEVMAARYRIGDGTGAAFAGLANNATQDANQALFHALETLPPSPLRRRLHRLLVPLGSVRTDWRDRTPTLGRTLEDDPLGILIAAAKSYRTIYPHQPARTLAHLSSRA